jgi:hypothetical protein
VDFFVKKYRPTFRQKCFYRVFELPLMRDVQKHNKKSQKEIKQKKRRHVRTFPAFGKTQGRFFFP